MSIVKNNVNEELLAPNGWRGDTVVLRSRLDRRRRPCPAGKDHRTLLSFASLLRSGRSKDATSCARFAAGVLGGLHAAKNAKSGKAGSFCRFGLGVTERPAHEICAVAWRLHRYKIAHRRA